jgi:hypothetical protein
MNLGKETELIVFKLPPPKYHRLWIIIIFYIWLQLMILII